MKKVKHTKKILYALTGFSVTILSIAAIAASCAQKNTNDKPNDTLPNNPNTKPNNPDNDKNASEANSTITPNNQNSSTELNNAEPSEDVKNWVNELALEVTQFLDGNPDKSKLHIWDLEDLNQIKIKLTGPKADLFSVLVTGVKPDYNDAKQNISVKTGHATLKLKIVHNKTKTFVEKDLEISGFKTEPYLVDKDGIIIDEKTATKEQERVNYLTSYTPEQRVAYENEDYLNQLKRQLNNESIDQVRPDLAAVTSTEKTKFDEKAKNLGLDTYNNQAFKGYTLPVYNNDGEFDGLSIAKKLPGQGPSWVDSYNRNQYRNKGLARVLLNKEYQTMGEQTFGISFTNKNQSYIKGNEENPNIPTSDPSKFPLTTSRGTVWILDYEKTTDGSYPTKWYFGTNLHVADLLRNNTRGVSLSRLNKNPPLQTKFTLTEHDSNFSTFIIGTDLKTEEETTRISEIFKVVYSATDFLEKDPSDYLASKYKEEFKDRKEFLDFAVIEVDFSKIKPNEWSIISKNNVVPENIVNNNAKVAEALTNNYANETDKQIKFLDYDYLSRNKENQAPLLKADFDKYTGDQFFLLGYPLAIEDFYFGKYDEERVKNWVRWSTSLWTNGKYEFFDKLVLPEVGTTDEERAEHAKELAKGGRFSYQVGYRSFLNKPGVSDAFIASPRNGDKYLTTHDGKQYVSFGLQYMPRDYEPFGGASGSSMRNQHNAVIGVYHTATRFTSTGLVGALRSEGFDYNGLYGTYNLPQYDLIFGGGKDQKTSYRQALKELNKNNPNVRTNIFPNGFEEENIEEKYRFKNEPSTSNTNNN
ncbi:DUF31 family protein [Ureaplasma sp. ES3154-GEN]|uniref:Ig-specific serine endopeptidase MIP n=1 Tax=Ureaplasma sp. ES3154-GEN TaxID=2984844 RepID=UPI0021E82FF2|nr:DUF31 family protein [Ureaplasma sp. ES3154-GEN]MCV3743326.1 DUF31 family protein [Ureaplasma sp. ES3154-GEN]